MTVAAIIVPFDLVDAHCFGDTWYLIKLAQIIPQIGIVGDAAQIALEMTEIDRIKADERREQPPVRFGDLLSREITLT